VAEAATLCGFDTTDFHDGAYSGYPHPGNTGAGATIDTQVPALCYTLVGGGNTASDSTIWAMSEGNNPNDGYTQSGYGRAYGQSTVYYFAEYSQTVSMRTRGSGHDE